MKKLFFLFAVLSFALISCEKEPFLTLSVQQITSTSSGNSTSITVNSNNPWTVSGNDWCTISPSSGQGGEVSVTVTVKENTTYDARNCTLTFTSEGLMASISVSQETNYGIVLPKDTYEIASDTKQLSVEVKANVNYDVTIDVDWIKQSGTKALTSKTFTFDIEENTTYDAREGTITIKEKNGSDTQTIKVKQAQKDAIIISSKEYNLTNEAQSIEIKLQTNVDIEVVIPDDAKEWISHTSTKALTEKTISLDVTKNKTFYARTSQIILKKKNDSFSDTIKLSQSQTDTLYVSGEKEFKFKTIGGNAEVTVFYNVDFIIDASSIPTWVSYESKDIDKNNKVFTFKVNPNNEYVERSSVIEFKSKTNKYKDKITITQDQLNTLYTEKQNYNLSKKGDSFEVLVYSNVDYTIEKPDWIKEVEVSIYDTKPVQTRYSYIVDAVNEERSGTILYRWMDEDVEKVSKVEVNQKNLSIIVDLKSAGTLLNEIGGAEYIAQVNELSISGPLNGDDFTVIERMTELQFIDMSGAHIVEGGIGKYKTKNNVYDAKAFTYHKKIEEVIMPSGIESIGYMSLSCMPSLRRVVLPEGLKTIGTAAFSSSGNLKDINIPISVTSIEIEAFGACRSLSKIQLPDGLTRIEQWTFRGTGLKNINLPESIVFIGTDAFSQSPLESITIPKNVTTIGMGAFWCTTLKEIHIKALPSTLKNISDNVFLSSGYGPITSPVYTDAILYIPKGTKEAYFLTDFGRFTHIVEE